MTKPIALIVTANDSMNGLKKIIEEAKALKTLLSNDDKYKVELINECSIDEILGFFSNTKKSGRVKIFHFAGHADSFSLLFTKGNSTQCANASKFAEFLDSQAGLDLIFLNACDTERHSYHYLNVQNIIFTHSKIKDEVAKTFAENFYSHYAQFDNIKDAYSNAVSKIEIQYTNKNNRAVYWEDEINIPDIQSWKYIRNDIFILNKIIRNYYHTED